MITLADAANHLWQSSVFAAAAALLAFALRRQRASVRYWVWLTASLKFLIPFAVLTAAGGALSWRIVEVIPYDNPAAVIETVSQPFSQAEMTVRPASRQAPGPELLPVLRSLAGPLWIAGGLVLLGAWFVRWGRIHRLRRRATRMTDGREVRALERIAHSRGLLPLPVYVTESTIEPGVFGFVRPVLLWPRGISERLTDDQIDAILAHELCHLRRRDNLASAAHMAVQAIFWFHPLAWWIGKRLVDERELACDEEVLQLGSEPEVYAEGILNTCKFFVESPLPCVAGVTGSDLKKRIERIMNHETIRPPSAWRQAILAAAALITFSTPVVFGALNPPPQTRTVAAPSALPSFEEVSVRPNTTAGRGGRGGQFQPARMAAQNITLKTLVKMAWAKPGATPQAALNLLDQEIAGGPEWLDADKFDIVATTPVSSQPTPPDRMRQMLQRMLADRFQLAAHWETRELPVYALVRARPDGPLAAGLIPRSDEECAKAKPLVPGDVPPDGLPPCGAVMFGPGQLAARGAPLEWLGQVLTTTPVVTGIDRPVLDRTGLQGNYGFIMTFAPANSPNPSPDRPDLFTALQEQLGLELEAVRAPIDVLVIDRAEKPEPN